MAKWLRTFELTGSPSAASAACNIDRTTPFRAAETDKVFRVAWQERKYAGVDVLEQSARLRAIIGWDEPVFHEGEVVGYKRKFSDRLLAELLRARNPAEFNRAAGDKGDQVSTEDRAAALRAALAAMDESVEVVSPAPSAS